MNESSSIVIVGGGHAAAALCGALVEAGQGHRIHLVGDEAVLPYQRPPLSKTYLKQDDATLQSHRAQAWYDEAKITLHLADRALTIDRAARRVTLASGATLDYATLVLATGARARTLPALPTGLTNVALLRSADDAARLRARLREIKRLVVLGGGFIGLEVAATARGLGLEVDVIEALPRLLARALSAELAEHVRASHEASGMRVRLGAKLGAFEIEAGRVAALQVGAERIECDLLVLGIGAAPDTALAVQAGLAIDNGIVVDSQMRTSDAAILAIGDCCNFPNLRGAGRLRLESVQNANDQARSAAATLLGRDEPYRALPWFWSDQGSLRLQMAGLAPPDGLRHRRPGPNGAGFSILHYDAGGRFACVETVNAPMDHMMARKILEAGKSPPPAQACDPAVPLKSLL